MSWLDNLLSVPAIGVRIKPISSINQFQNSLNNIFDILRDKYSEIKIQQTDLWGFAIKPSKISGFNYNIKLNNIGISYSYHLTQNIISGKFPVIEYPELYIYSDLLNNNSDEILFIFDVFTEIADIKYDRIGIVADSTLPKDNYPPGVATWIEYMGAPWDGKITKIDISMLSRLIDNDNYIDQCHHLLNFDDSVQGNEVKFKLDWQRIFNKPISPANNNLCNDLNSCISSAKEYFEKFGEGDLNYEK
jgi:hypothetical protein